MSDINPEPASPVQHVVPQWRPSPTLAALETLVDVAGAVPATLAHRAGLSTS